MRVEAVLREYWETLATKQQIAIRDSIQEVSNQLNKTTTYIENRLIENGKIDKDWDLILFDA